MVFSLLEAALYKGNDVTGTIFGGYEVLGLVGYTHNKNGHKQHRLWSVRCIHCDKTFIQQGQHVVESKFGCKDCKGSQMSGINSVHWKGGIHVPGFFVAKIKNKNLERRSKTIEFNLSYKYLDLLWEDQDGRCAYTGEKLFFGKNGVAGNASLDRINSSIGYIEGNVQFVHKDVNIMKWDLSEDRFLDICEKITNNRRQS